MSPIRRHQLAHMLTRPGVVAGRTRASVKVQTRTDALRLHPDHDEISACLLDAESNTHTIPDHNNLVAIYSGALYRRTPTPKPRDGSGRTAKFSVALTLTWAKAANYNEMVTAVRMKVQQELMRHASIQTSMKRSAEAWGRLLSPRQGGALSEVWFPYFVRVRALDGH